MATALPQRSGHQSSELEAPEAKASDKADPALRGPGDASAGDGGHGRPAARDPEREKCESESLLRQSC